MNFNWLAQEGVLNAIDLIYKVLKIVRIIVPIGLIAMTTMDITKKVINPEDKDGQKKIMLRLIAALIVFVIPTIINFILKFAGIEKVDLEQDSNNGGGTQVISNTPSPTIIPIQTPMSVSCPAGEYLPANSNKCSTCLANYYCTGGIFKLANNSSNQGLTYCGDDYTSPIGSTDLSYCVKKASNASLSTLKISNCPNTAVFYDNDVITLNTNIPSDYKGTISWGFVDENKNVKAILTPLPNQKSATLKISNISSKGTLKIKVSTAGITDICSINYDIKNTKCDPPTNVNIQKSGIGAGLIKWDDSATADGYEISLNQSNWIAAYSGYDLKKLISGSPGLKTIYVRGLCGSSVSTNINSATVNVYQVKVNKDAGIDFVRGEGNFIEGTTITISAITLNNYSWDYWLSNKNGKITQQNYSFIVNGDETFTAYGKR